MAITVKTWIQRGVEIATRGIPIETATALDAEGLAEPLLEQVLTGLAEEYAAQKKYKLLSRTLKTLSVSSGTVSLTSDVIESALDDSVLYDPADKAKLYSFVPDWHDFSTAYDARLGYYTVRQYGTMHVTEPGTLYDVSTGPTVSLRLDSACYWSIPANINTDLSVPSEVETDLIAKLAEALRGAILKNATDN